MKAVGKVDEVNLLGCYKGILLIDYLPNGQTNNGEYYAKLLDQVNKLACVRTKSFSIRTMHVHIQVNELKHHMLQHPPYSPDLAPSDFHLFSRLKILLFWKKFSGFCYLQYMQFNIIRL